MTLSVLGSYCPQWPCAARTIPIHCISCSSAALTVRLFSLARARSRFAPVLACALLASLAARWPPRLLLAPFVLPLPARVARRLACCSRFARASPAASHLSLALHAPCLLLASLASSPAARCARLACCSLLTAAPAPLTASPAALASRAASPAAARRFACGCSLPSPSHLLARLTLLLPSPSSISGTGASGWDLLRKENETKRNEKKLA